MAFEANSKASASNTNSKQQQDCGPKAERCVTSKRTKRLFIAFAAISIAAVVMVFHNG